MPDGSLGTEVAFLRILAQLEAKVRMLEEAENLPISGLSKKFGVLEAFESRLWDHLSLLELNAYKYYDKLMEISYRLERIRRRVEAAHPASETTGFWRGLFNWFATAVNTIAIAILGIGPVLPMLPEPVKVDMKLIELNLKD
jgi:hypothetical protein